MPGGKVQAWADVLRLEYQGDNLVTWFTVQTLAVGWGAPLAPGWVLLGTAMLMCSAAATELLDGYHDFKQGAHRVKGESEQVWSGGSGVLANERIDPATVNRAAWTVGSLAMVLLAATLFRTGWVGVGFSVVALVCSVGWSMPPLKLSYRGLGELTVFVVAGPLLAGLSCLVAMGRLETRAVLVGIPFGLLELAMALMHGIADRENDAAAGKRTLIVRIGDKWAATVHVVALVLAYASLVGLVLLDVLPLGGLCALVTIPFALQSGRMALAAAIDRRTISDSMRSFPAYKAHAGVGLVLVVVCGVDLPMSQATFLLGLFGLCYAPVIWALNRRLRPG